MDTFVLSSHKETSNTLCYLKNPFVFPFFVFYPSLWTVSFLSICEEYPLLAEE